jgi:6-phosphogluconolactonase
VYGSNRGHDTIAIFAVMPETCTLTPIDFASAEGQTPRGFRLSASGGYLFVANQDSDNIVTFKVDTETGTFAPIGVVRDARAPVCLVIL